MDELENFSNRLKRWRARPEKPLDQKQAAKVLGIGRTYFSELENGRRPAGKFLRQKFEAIEFASAAEISAILADKYDVWKRLQNESEGGRLSAKERSGAYGAGGLRRIPLIGWAQACDAVNLVDFNDTVNWENFVPSDIRDPKAIAVLIRGDSMEPEYKEGDIAILACSAAPASGNLIVGRLKKEGAVFKMFQILNVDLGKFRLTSFNSHYAPIERNADDFLWIYPVHSVIKKLM